MSRQSRNDDAIEIMREANPVSATKLGTTISDVELAGEIRRAVAVGERPAPQIPVDGWTGTGRRVGHGGVLARHRGISLAFGLACAVGVAALIVFSGGSVDSVRDGAHPAYAAAAVEVAEANPRLLVTAPDWSTIHARGFEVDSGELIYKDGAHPAYDPGGRQLELFWAPARLYRSRLAEDGRVRTRAGHPAPVTSTLLGQRATTFRYPGQRPNYATILSPQENVFVEINATLSKREYEAVLRSLRRVSVDAWLAAMPPEVVQPATRSAGIAQMLERLPVPPNFDASTLQSDTVLSDRFMLAKAVAGAVACDWLHRWSSAAQAGDNALAQEAVKAMGSARHWPILIQMVRERGYRGSELPLHGRGWPSQIVAAGREIDTGHLRRKPAVRTIYVKGHVAGYITPANAAPASVLGCTS